MSDTETQIAPLTPAQKLALIVAQRKANAAGGNWNGGRKEAERSAAARSASKSKPAMRK
jgi:hypothetical protein